MLDASERAYTILRQVAKSAPIEHRGGGWHSQCLWCRVFFSVDTNEALPEKHAVMCAWRLAKEFIAELDVEAERESKTP